MLLAAAELSASEASSIADCSALPEVSSPDSFAAESSAVELSATELSSVAEDSSAVELSSSELSSTVELSSSELSSLLLFVVVVLLLLPALESSLDEHAMSPIDRTKTQHNTIKAFPFIFLFLPFLSCIDKIFYHLNDDGSIIPRSTRDYKKQFMSDL